MDYEDGTLITDRSSHEIYVVENGKLRWVPDSWTMQAAGLSPADLQVVDDDSFAAKQLGKPLPSTLPSPPFLEGAVIESEAGVWRVRNGKLDRVVDPMELVVKEGLDPSDVVFLPHSIIRSALRIDG